MLTLRLTEISNDTPGSSGGRERVIEADCIRIGRSPQAQLSLDGPGVDSEHARIFLDDQGRPCIAVEAGSSLVIDAHPAAFSCLESGQRIEIGGFSMLVTAVDTQASPTVSLSISRRMVVSPGARAPRVLSIESLIGSKRRMSVWLSVAIIVLGFLVPLATFHFPDFERWQASMHFSLSGLLSPGRLSSGHEAFGMKCSSCHEKAFAGVTNGACLACHTQVGEHLAAAGDVARVPGDEVKCVACHAAHEGKSRGVGAGVAQCISCHQGQGGSLSEYRDFSGQHPAFHLAVREGETTRRLPDSRQAEISERHGLKFSHRKHLAKEGVSTPEGDTVLKCANCHRPDMSGRGFAEMRMATTCQQSRCHTLRFAEPMRGKVPHGSLGAILDRVRHQFLNSRLDEAANGTLTAIRGLSATAAAEAVAYVDQSLLSREEGKLQCRLCHEVPESGSDAMPWKIAPVSTRHKWHAKADFDHSKHATESCAYCHDKARSEASGDISIPVIGKCRECHAGQHREPVKVRSYCESCHHYHRVPATASRQVEAERK